MSPESRWGRPLPPLYPAGYRGLSASSKCELQEQQGQIKHYAFGFHSVLDGIASPHLS